MGILEGTPPASKELPIPQRVDILLGDYEAAHELQPISVLIDHEAIAIQQGDEIKGKSPYVSVRATRTLSDGQHNDVLITTPVNHEVSNMVSRIGRSAVLRNHILNNRELFPSTIRFPKVLDVRADEHPQRGIYVGSVMDEWIETTRVDRSLHLVEPDVFTADDMRDMASAFHTVQQIGQEFTHGEEFYHFRISVPFSDHDNNKWWIDYEKNPARLATYEKIFGAQFVTDLGKLLGSTETAAMFTDDAPRYLVFGNIIPAKLGKDSDGNVVFRDTERTAYTQYRAFDYATFLSTLVTDVPMMEEFISQSIEQNHDAQFLQQLRRSLLLDRLGNLVDIVADHERALKTGSPDAEFLEQAILNFKQLAEDALYQRGQWNPDQYNFISE